VYSFNTSCFILSNEINFTSFLDYYFEEHPYELTNFNYTNINNTNNLTRCNLTDYEIPFVHITNLDDLKILINYLEIHSNNTFYQLNNLFQLLDKVENEEPIINLLCERFFYTKVKNYFDYEIVSTEIDEKIKNSLLKLLCDTLISGLTLFKKNSSSAALKITYNNDNWPFKSTLIESVRTAHILKTKRKKIRPDYEQWKYTNETIFNMTTFKFYAINTIAASLLSIKGKHPLHNNPFKYSFHRAKAETFNYWKTNTHKEKTRIFKNLFNNLYTVSKTFYSNMGNITTNMNVINIEPIISEPLMLYTLNDTSNLTLVSNITQIIEDYFDIGQFFTLEFWWPDNSLWRGYNLSKNESYFRSDFLSDYLYKLWYNINCVRRTDIIRDLIPSIYQEPIPEIGLLPCFWLVDPINYNGTTTITIYILIKRPISTLFVDDLNSLTLCSSYNGFFYFYDGILFPFRIILSSILQPFTCGFASIGDPVYTLLRLLVFQPEKCAYSYKDLGQKIFCLASIFIGFGILFAIFIIPFFIICCCKCIEDFRRNTHRTRTGNNEQKIILQKMEQDKLEQKMYEISYKLEQQK